MRPSDASETDPLLTPAAGVVPDRPSANTAAHNNSSPIDAPKPRTDEEDQKLHDGTPRAKVPLGPLVPALSIGM